MAGINLKSVIKRFGDIQTIHGIDLDIQDGEFTVFVGPSGCGKSTLLRLIAGLEDITEGSIHIGDEDVTNADPADRGVAMVFQSYALYPHMTVAENMGFGLKMANAPASEIQERVQKASNILQLDYLMDRQPKELSGGQRQRVAIGRAIVRDPKVFLFDEPLSNLDAELRVEMRIQISRLHKQLGNTMVYVTHDQVEAMTLADKIVVLRDGRVEQVGSPLELYYQPANLFVAGFIGSPKMNFIPVEVKSAGSGEARVQLPSGMLLTLPAHCDQLTSGAIITLGIRPEHLLTEQSDLADFHIKFESDVVERLGNSTYLFGRSETVNNFKVHLPSDEAVTSGQSVELGVEYVNLHLFDGDGKSIRDYSSIEQPAAV